MSLLHDQHQAHIARRQRLWPTTKQALVPRKEPPIPVAIEPPPTPEAVVKDKGRTELSKIRHEADLIEEQFDKIIQGRGFIPRQPPLSLIVRAVCVYYGVKRVDLFSARRTSGVVRPRQIAMYLAKTLTVKSYPEIGRRIGGRDHTTCLHAFRKIDSLRKSDTTLAAELHELASALSFAEDEPEPIPAFLPVRKP